MNNLSENELSFLSSIAVPIETPSAEGGKKTSYLSPEESSFINILPEIIPQENDQSFLGMAKEAFRGLEHGARDVAKGAIKGIGEFGESFSPTIPYIDELPIDKQGRADQLEHLIPSRESEGKEGRKRFGELAPMALIGPGGAGQALARTALAVNAGQVGEELGGETGKAIGELSAFIAPNPTRLLQSRNAVRQNLIDFGRANGMTEEGLTIATKPDNWYQNMLARTSIKYGPARRQVEQTQAELGNIYDRLRALPEAQQTLQVNQMQNFVGNANARLQALPANLRTEVMPDMVDFLNSRRTGADLINLYQDINDTVARIGGERGLRTAGMLEPITNAIADLSPALAVDFGLTNNLYANFARMRTALRPGLTDHILTGAKAAGAVWSLATGDFVNLTRLSTVAAARGAATALVLSPRLQNLQHKMLTAMNQNRVTVANKALESFKQEMKDEAPEYYEYIKDASFSSVEQKKVVNDKVANNK